MKSSDFLKLITKYLQKEGYKRKGNRWFKPTEECKLIIHLQKAPWGGETFYINLLVQVLDTNESRGLSYWDIDRRLSIFEDDRPYYLKDLLNLESDINDEYRENEIRRVLLEIVVPWLDALGSLEGIRRALKTGQIHESDIWTTRVKELVCTK